MNDNRILATLGERMKQERLQRDLTQAELADRAGVGVRTLAKMESGGMTTLATLIAILRGLDLLERLVELANAALRQKTLLKTHLGTTDKQALEAMPEILRVGTSAGGARAKAVIAWNQDTDEIRSGQVSAEQGFEYWLIKFDGVDGNRDKELNDPQGYGRLEYAYYLMATAAGMEMMASILRHENGRSHFMTQRFDRTADGGKVMMQSLCAMAHFDFHQAGAYSYEQALQVAQRLQLPSFEMVQLFRRMVFNVLARNQDDHTKNIAFLMDRSGRWRLSPAFDVTYSYHPQGDWTSRHQMRVNGKRDAFGTEDLLSVAKSFRRIGVQRGKDVISHVQQVLSKWMDFAKEAGVSESWSKRVAADHRQG